MDSNGDKLQSSLVMNNKNVIAVFVIGLALLLAAFWAGLYVVRQDGAKPRGGSAPQTTQPVGSALAAAEPAPSETPTALSADQTSGDTRFIVQMGGFGTAEKAKELESQLRRTSIYTSATVQNPTAGDTLYRVQIGPYSAREDAQQVADGLASKGYKGVMIKPWKPN
jgi:cell division septation protein DedD